ncbi:unnamed protein product, partial [Ectocarpus fasciculatus]
GVGVAPNEGGGVANAPPPPSSRLPPVPRPKGSPCSGLVSSVGSLSPPRFVGGDSMFLVSDIEEGKERWFRRGSPTGTATAGGGGIGRRGSISGGGTRTTSAESFGGGIELLRGGDGGREAQDGRGRSAHSPRGRSASFDHAAILEGRVGGGSSCRMGGSRLLSRGRRWRGVPGESPGAMEGLNPEIVGRTEHLVRGRKTLFGMLRKAARRGMEAVDKAAHAMGINRIPFLRQCLWGQVHTGFWDAYECVRGELHTCIRETVIDWVLSEDNPPDIKIYVTGHSMGGALATHCTMDLKLFTVDKIQARLGNFMRTRRTL